MNRYGDKVRAEAAGIQAHVSNSRIVAANSVSCADNDFCTTVVFDCEWRTPRTALLARCAPQLFAVAFVERDHERLAFVIENEKQSIDNEQRRDAFTKREAHLHLDVRVFFPDQFAVEVIGKDAA